MSYALQLLAGPKALALIRERGLRAADVDIVVGASGGPKWLVLAELDRLVFGEFFDAERERPLHLIGSSVGGWRMACLAQRDPVAAIDRFETAYIGQRYTREPPPSEVSRVCAALLDVVLGKNGDHEILEHPFARLHVITARSRGLAASEYRTVQLAGLAFAAVANAISRRSLRAQFQRVIFDAAGDAGPFRGLAGFATRHVPLTRENLRAVLIASGSIPLVLDGVRIPGAPPGIYRDGGVIDYHPDFDFGHGDGIVLYPHFYPHITPGWFDKGLPWRKPRAENFERVLLLAPGADFVTQLPGGKIPDRTDFYTHSEAERMRIWRQVREASRRLGDEFAELMATGRWMERVRPLVLR
jgi:hypothetical protein